MRRMGKLLIVSICLLLVVILPSSMPYASTWPETVEAAAAPLPVEALPQVILITPTPDIFATPMPEPVFSFNAGPVVVNVLPPEDSTIPAGEIDPNDINATVPVPQQTQEPASTEAVPAAPLEPGEEPLFRLTIDVTNQVVKAWRRAEGGGEEYDVLVREMICSTGTKSDPTPLGVFELPDATRYRWSYFPKFKVYAQYQTRIKGSILFHSILYQKNRLDTMITSSYRNLGKRASHGCIRLLPEDARWIYEYCPPGTEVEVFKGEPEEDILNRLKPISLSSWYPEHAKKPPDTMRSPDAYDEATAAITVP